MNINDMNSLKIKNILITLVDQVEGKLLDYFRFNKMKPGDPVQRKMNWLKR